MALLERGDLFVRSVLARRARPHDVARVEHLEVRKHEERDDARQLAVNPPLLQPLGAHHDERNARRDLHHDRRELDLRHDRGGEALEFVADQGSDTSESRSADELLLGEAGPEVRRKANEVNEEQRLMEHRHRRAEN